MDDQGDGAGTDSISPSPMEVSGHKMWKMMKGHWKRWGKKLQPTYSSQPVKDYCGIYLEKKGIRRRRILVFSSLWEVLRIHGKQFKKMRVFGDLQMTTSLEIKFTMNCPTFHKILSNVLGRQRGIVFVKCKLALLSILLAIIKNMHIMEEDNNEMVKLHLMVCLKELGPAHLVNVGYAVIVNTMRISISSKKKQFFIVTKKLDGQIYKAVQKEVGFAVKAFQKYTTLAGKT
ncbi:hypothetical protein ACLOJK_018450 [Asimina triloba]